MANSARFTKLEQRLEELRNNFLPSTFSPTGVYTPKEEDLAKGYRVLVHAEIEAFLEDIARAAVVSKATDYKTNGQISNILFTLMAAALHGFVDDNESPSIERVVIKVKKDSDTILDTVEAAIQKYQNRVGANNGIKLLSLKVIFLPLGIDFTQLDDVWLSNMNSFGRDRGDVAHQSSGTTKSINPEDELKNVTALMIGLSTLDEMLLNLL